MRTSFTVITLLFLLAPPAAAQGVRYLTRVTVKSPGVGIVDPVLMPQSPPANTTASPAPVTSSQPPRAIVYRPPASNPPDLDRKLLDFHQKRAAAGAPHAQLSLARRYLNGDGVPKDLAAAKKWLNAAAENGSLEAAKILKEMGDGRAVRRSDGGTVPRSRM